MIAAIALGTVGFWIFMFFIAIEVTWLVETDHGFFSATSLFITAFILNYSYHIPVFASMVAHPFHVLSYLIGYVAIGAGWGLVKWFVFVHKRLEQYNEYKAAFLRSRNATVLTPALAADLVERMSGDYASKASAKAPIAREHKAAIIRWMAYWPFSILGTLLNDFVRKIFNIIYKYLLGVYESISINVFRDASQDLVIAQQHQQDNERRSSSASV